MPMRLLARWTGLGAIRSHAVETCCNQGQGFIQGSPGPAQPEQHRRQDTSEGGDGVGAIDPMVRVNVMFVYGGEAAQGV